MPLRLETRGVRALIVAEPGRALPPVPCAVPGEDETLVLLSGTGLLPRSEGACRSRSQWPGKRGRVSGALTAGRFSEGERDLRSSRRSAASGEAVAVPNRAAASLTPR